MMRTHRAATSHRLRRPVLALAASLSLAGTLATMTAPRASADDTAVDAATTQDADTAAESADTEITSIAASEVPDEAYKVDGTLRDDLDDHAKDEDIPAEPQTGEYYADTDLGNAPFDETPEGYPETATDTQIDENGSAVEQPQGRITVKATEYTVKPYADEKAVSGVTVSLRPQSAGSSASREGTTDGAGLLANTGLASDCEGSDCLYEVTLAAPSGWKIRDDDGSLHSTLTISDVPARLLHTYLNNASLQVSNVRFYDPTRQDQVTPAFLEITSEGTSASIASGADPIAAIFGISRPSQTVFTFTGNDGAQVEVGENLLGTLTWLNSHTANALRDFKLAFDYNFIDADGTALLATPSTFYYELQTVETSDLARPCRYPIAGDFNTATGCADKLKVQPQAASRTPLPFNFDNLMVDFFPFSLGYDVDLRRTNIDGTELRAANAPTETQASRLYRYDFFAAENSNPALRFFYTAEATARYVGNVLAVRLVKDDDAYPFWPVDDTPAPREVIEEVAHQEPIAAETVTAYAAPQLANTGASVVALTGLAGLATLAGAGAIAAGRRRV